MGISPAKAKHFIVDRVLDQARLDGVSLGRVEIQMLGFEAQTTNAKDLELEQRFQDEVDKVQYEKTIARLIERANQRDKESQAPDAWEEPLETLAGEDLYLNVMIQQAGISDGSGLANLINWPFFIQSIPAFFFISVGSFIAFSRTGAKLIPNNSLRLGILILSLIAPLVVNWLNRKRLRKTQL